MRGARFVVVPVRQTIQPSGQSVCLQAMSCGKAVIMSDIDGLWERGLMSDGETCVLVPCGSVPALHSAAAGLLARPSHAARIGKAARKVVENHLNVEAMASSMRKLVSGLS